MQDIIVEDDTKSLNNLIQNISGQVWMMSSCMENLQIQVWQVHEKNDNCIHNVVLNMSAFIQLKYASAVLTVCMIFFIGYNEDLR